MKKIFLKIFIILIIIGICALALVIFWALNNPFNKLADWYGINFATSISINEVIITGITEETRLITAVVETRCAIQADRTPGHKFTPWLSNILEKFFEKRQLISFYGNALFTVDLGQLMKEDINEYNGSVIISVPAPQFSHIYLNPDKIGFTPTETGIFILGEMSFTAEEFTEMEILAISVMTENLNNDAEITSELNANAETALRELIRAILSDSEFSGHEIIIDWKS